jgi:hypothetical protein
MFLLGRISPRADITLRKDCNSHPLATIEVFEKHKRSFTQKSRCRGRSDRISVRPATKSLHGGKTFDKRPSTDDLYSAAGQQWLGVTLILLDLAQRVRASQHIRWPANLFRFANLSATV